MKLKLRSKVVENIDPSDITSKAVLCSLMTKCWGNTKKIPIESMKKITNKEFSKRIRSNKGLIDKEALSDINSLITKARNVIKSYSLPFPIDGIFLIPKSLVVKLNEELNEVISKLKPAVDEFVSSYDEFIEEARGELEEFFNEGDYPTDIGSKFDIQYKFVELGVPSSLSEFSPDIYQQEVNKLKETFTETRNECILFLRKAFVAELKDVLSAFTEENEDGKKRILRQDTLNKVEKFFESFQSKNIFDDKELMNIIKTSKDILTGFDAKDLRNNDVLREAIGDELSKVAKEAEKSVIAFSRRITL